MSKVYDYILLNDWLYVPLLLCSIFVGLTVGFSLSAVLIKFVLRPLGEWVAR